MVEERAVVGVYPYNARVVDGSFSAVSQQVPVAAVARCEYLMCGIKDDCM